MIHLKILFSISKTLGLLSYRPGFQQVEISMKDNIRIPLNLKLRVQPCHFGLSKSINQQAKKVTPMGVTDSEDHEDGAAATSWNRWRNE